MRKLTIRTITALLALAGVALAMTPASAGTLYRWVAEDGTIAFTDDADRVPDRYQDAAVKIETKSLEGFERFTPTDAAAQSEYRARLDQRLARLRELNALLDGTDNHVARAHPAQRPGFEAVVQVNDTTSLRVPVTGSDEPMIVEEVRVRRPGQMVTGHDTIVRQGDDVHMVVRPQQMEGPPSVDEGGFLGR